MFVNIYYLVLIILDWMLEVILEELDVIIVVFDKDYFLGYDWVR